MDKLKHQDKKKIFGNRNINDLQFECRDLLNQSNYNFDRTMDNKQFHSLLLKSSKSRTSLLVWALRELGVDATTCNHQSLFELLHSLGILSSKENGFVEGSLNALSQLRKWKLIFQCAMVKQYNDVIDDNHDDKFENKEFEVMKLKKKILPDDLEKQFQRTWVKIKNDKLSEGDIENEKEELKKEENHNTKTYDEFINEKNNLEEYWSRYFQVRNDLDHAIQRYLSLDLKETEVNMSTDQSCLNADILPNIIKETDSILNEIKIFEDVQT